MISIVVCEDIQAEAEQLEAVIRQVAAERDFEVELQHFTCGEHLLLNHVKGEPTLVFIDVMLGSGMNGIQTAHRLREIDEDLPIVFVTSSSEYALQGYDVQALHYLMKPVTVEKMRAVFDRCEYVFKNRRRTMELVCNRTEERILVRDIIYAEVHGNLTTVHLGGQTLESYTSLAQITNQAPDVLLRCHRSFVVNMAHIRRVQGREFIMDNGENVPIRTNGASEAITRYQEFLTRDL